MGKSMKERSSKGSAAKLAKHMGSRKMVESVAQDRMENSHRFVARKRNLPAGFTALQLSPSGGSAGDGMEQLSLMSHAASALSWPDHVRIYRVEDDTMTPRLNRGDIIAVDTLQREVMEGVYALDLWGTVTIRRLQPTFDGRIKVLTDNKDYRQTEIAAADIDPNVIIGRVIFAEVRFS